MPPDIYVNKSERIERVLQSMVDSYTDDPDAPMDYNVCLMCRQYYDKTISSYARSIIPIPEYVDKLLILIKYTSIHAEESVLYKDLVERLELKRIDSML